MNPNWQTKKLGEVIKLEYGKPLPKSDRKTDGRYPIYGANGIKSWSNKFYYDKPTIIVGRKGSAGEINLVEEKFWPLDVTYFTTFDAKKYDLKFLYNLLKNLELPKLAKGVKPGINRNDIYKIKVPLPPLSEQRRIVKILDEVFGQIEKVKANTQKNLENSKELFESYLKYSYEGNNEWLTKNLFEVAEINKDKNGRKDLPYIGMEDIESNSGKFIGSFEPKSVKSSSFYFNDKHILYGRLRPYLNKVLIPDFEGHCSTEIFPIRVNNSLDKKFLFYWLIKRSTTERINSTCTGARMPRANMNKVFKDFKVVFPKSLTEQKQIVAKLDDLSEKTKKLEQNYRQKLADLEELKKSVLNKAFSGEL